MRGILVPAGRVRIAVPVAAEQTAATGTERRIWSLTGQAPGVRYFSKKAVTPEGE
jgi:hypothetical protein